MPNKQIIGLTGSFGSGCSYIMENVLQDKLSFECISLADILREQYDSETGEKADSAKRSDLQTFGDKFREDKGEGAFAKIAIEKIIGQSDKHRWVIKSIKNPGEIDALRDEFHDDFFLFGIFSEKETRWNRVNNEYDGNRKRFDEDDENDTGRRSDKHGQRVQDCFMSADVLLSNDKDIKSINSDDFSNLCGHIEKYVRLFFHPDERQASSPTMPEVLMAIAYGISQSSSCLRRKVGAIIVDKHDNIISSGYNETPRAESSCKSEYGDCFRKIQRTELEKKLKGNGIVTDDNIDIFQGLFKENIRQLDICRAVHAEENAILSLTRNGMSSDLDKCTLYTTTHPCRLCANKIVMVGIKHVYYTEPYPDAESVAILENDNVLRHFFTGVTFRAYSRVYGERK